MLRKAVPAVLFAMTLAGCHANPKYVCAPPQPASCQISLCAATPLTPPPSSTRLP
jgi:hypothetical protein